MRSVSGSNEYPPESFFMPAILPACLAPWLPLAPPKKIEAFAFVLPDPKVFHKYNKKNAI